MQRIVFVFLSRQRFTNLTPTTSLLLPSKSSTIISQNLLNQSLYKNLIHKTLKSFHWAIHIFIHLKNYLTYFLRHILPNHQEHTKIETQQILFSFPFFLVSLKHIATTQPATIYVVFIQKQLTLFLVFSESMLEIQTSVASLSTRSYKNKIC